MQDTENDQALAKALREEPPAKRGALAALVVQQTWAWRLSGAVFSVLFAAVIAVLTLSPLPEGAQVTGGIDKVYHFIAFAFLVFPLILTDARRWIWAVPLCMSYGALIELIQPSFGRAAEWLDFGADVTGVLAGAALAEILHDRIRDRFFAVETPADEDEDEAEARRMEAMRAELMDELRVVLREELAGINREAAKQGPQTHPFQTGPAKNAPPRGRPAPGARPQPPRPGDGDDSRH